MKKIQWDPLKSERLKKVRGVSFEEIINAKVIDTIKSPSRDGQLIMLFEHANYIWAVPFIDNNGMIFLKTLYPSRKFTKMYLQ